MPGDGFGCLRRVDAVATARRAATARIEALPPAATTRASVFRRFATAGAAMSEVTFGVRLG
jgi:hypothetical protein